MSNLIATCSNVSNGGYIVSSVTSTGYGTGYTNYPWPPYVTNYGAICTAGTVAASSIHSMTSAITITGVDQKSVLHIYTDGRVEWNGSLTKCATQFVKVIEHTIDVHAASKRALAKSYRLAIERCLRQVKQMSNDDFIAMLENELDVRMRKAVLMCLTDDHDND